MAKNTRAIKRKLEPVEETSAKKKNNLLKPYQEEDLVESKIADDFCWICHEVVASEEINKFCCLDCLKSFHNKCRVKLHRSNSICECQWKSSDGNSAPLECDDLNLLLTRVFSHAMSEIDSVTGENLHDILYQYRSKVCELSNKYNICEKIDLVDLVERVMRSFYKSTGSFYQDVKLFTHNGVILSKYSADSEYLRICQMVKKIVKQEIQCAEGCADCYLSCTFTNVCTNPHLIVWAKIKDYNIFWPAKALRALKNNRMIDVRYFYTHTRGIVPTRYVYKISQDYPGENITDFPPLNEALEELEEYIKNFENQHHRFKYFPVKTPVYENVMKTLQWSQRENKSIRVLDLSGVRKRPIYRKLNHFFKYRNDKHRNRTRTAIIPKNLTINISKGSKLSGQDAENFIRNLRELRVDLSSSRTVLNEIAADKIPSGPSPVQSIASSTNLPSSRVGLENITAHKRSLPSTASTNEISLSEIDQPLYRDNESRRMFIKAGYNFQSDSTSESFSSSTNASTNDPSSIPSTSSNTNTSTNDSSSISSTSTSANASTNDPTPSTSTSAEPLDKKLRSSDDDDTALIKELKETLLTCLPRTILIFPKIFDFAKKLMLLLHINIKNTHDKEIEKVCIIDHAAQNIEKVLQELKKENENMAKNIEELVIKLNEKNKVEEGEENKSKENNNKENETSKDLTKELAEKDKGITSLKESDDNLEKKKEILKTGETELSQSSNKNLSVECNELKKKVADLIKQNKILKKQYNAANGKDRESAINHFNLQKHYKELKKIADLKKQNKTLRGEIEKIKKNGTKIESSNLMTRVELYNLIVDNKQVVNYLKSSPEEIKTLEKDETVLTTDNLKLCTECEKFLKKIAGLEKQNEILSNENIDLKKEGVNLKKQTENVCKEHEVIQKEKTNLENKYKKLCKELKDYLKTFDNLRTQNKCLTEEKAEVDREFISASNLNNSFLQKSELFTQRQSLIDERNKALQLEFEDVKKINEELLNVNKLLGNATTNLKCTNMEINEEFEAAKTKFLSLFEQNQQLRKKNEMFQGISVNCREKGNQCSTELEKCEKKKEEFQNVSDSYYQGFVDLTKYNDCTIDQKADAKCQTDTFPVQTKCQTHTFLKLRDPDPFQRKSEEYEKKILALIEKEEKKKQQMHRPGKIYILNAINYGKL